MERPDRGVISFCDARIILDVSSDREYTHSAADSFGVKEVSKLYAYIVDLLISVTAGVISYYICKWLDGE